MHDGQVSGKLVDIDLQGSVLTPDSVVEIAAAVLRVRAVHGNVRIDLRNASVEDGAAEALQVLLYAVGSEHKSA